MGNIDNNKIDWKLLSMFVAIWRMLLFIILYGIKYFILIKKNTQG